MKFTQNTQIHCTSQKEWQDCLEKFQSLGIEWSSSVKATDSYRLNMWENFKYTSRYIRVKVDGDRTSLAHGPNAYEPIQLTAAQFLNSYEGGVVVHGPKEMIVPFFESLKALGYSERPDDIRWNQTHNPTKGSGNCTYLWSGCPRESVGLQWHSHLCGTKPENQFTLPEQWSQAFEAMRACIDSYTPKFNGPWKVGDTITRDELNNPNVTRWNRENWESRYGMFDSDRTIESIEYVDGRWEMRVSGTTAGVKLDASTVVKGYVPPFKIGDYEAKIDKVNGTIEFGCQIISKSEIETMLKMTQSPINADIKIHGTDITTSMLNEMLAALE
jgi:hypothetical protein